MKCPYTLHREQVTEYKDKINDDGKRVGEKIKLIETRGFGECVQEECAAWRDGGCWHRGN